MIESDTGIDLIEFDLFGLGQEVIQSGEFLNTTDSCLFEDSFPLVPKPECDFEMPFSTPFTRQENFMV